MGEQVTGGDLLSVKEWLDLTVDIFLSHKSLKDKTE